MPICLAINAPGLNSRPPALHSFKMAKVTHLAMESALKKAVCSYLYPIRNFRYAMIAYHFKGNTTVYQIGIVCIKLYIICI